MATTNSSTDPKWGPSLTDILQRRPSWDKFNHEDLETLAHELSHGIHSDLRLKRPSTPKLNGFYVLGGQGAIVLEPSFRKADVAALVPQSLRGSRYDHYLTGQKGWDDQPLYLWDEWNSYVNGAAVAIERYSLGLQQYPANSANDRVYAVLEFTIYALMVLHTAEQREPQYLTREPQAREFFAWNAQRAMRLFQAGRHLPPFRWTNSDTLEQALRTSPDAEQLRQSARRLLGAGFTHQTFGF